MSSSIISYSGGVDFEKKSATAVQESRQFHPKLQENIYIVPANERITSDYMTDFEYVNCLSIRARQIQESNTAFIPIPVSSTPIEIAKAEMAALKCPLSILRMINAVTAEQWEVNEMIKPLSI